MYEGEWKDNKYNGKGIRCYISGTYVKGSFKEGNLVEGAIFYKNGDSYEGSFRNNLFHGSGIYKLANGRSYKGEYENGHRVNCHERTSRRGIVTIKNFQELD